MRKVTVLLLIAAPLGAAVRSGVRPLDQAPAMKRLSPVIARDVFVQAPCGRVVGFAETRQQ